jgi:hypothetical protein
MSAQVLQFPPQKITGTQPRTNGPVKERLYFCTGCKEDRFHVDMDGMVWCGRCKGFISNLRVT